MQKEVLIFDKSGFPSIKIFDKHFEIKAIDNWTYRSFKYSEIKEIFHYDPNKIWWRKLYMQLSYTARMFSNNEPKILKVLLKNGGEWTYKTSSTYDPQFRKALHVIGRKLC
ncbi:hypothetical protein [Aequorivita sediminis]|uniref:hypothetical protein n=1 Tax=Aequorivita sediminis TaxID=3073653 RepID=UPI0028B0C4C6|nr:hypothetical protein [Aequorivita sp. F6058]